jgi:hypothetical protein
MPFSDASYWLLPRELRDYIEDYLTLGDLKRLCRVPHLAPFARGVLRGRFCRLMKRFHLLDDEIREMMRTHNTVIYGVQSASIVNPTHPPSGPLDLSCPKDEGDSVLTFLRSRDYEHIPSSETDVSIHETRRGGRYQYTITHGKRRSFSLQRKSTGDRVLLTESLSSSALLPMFLSPCTIDMNYITGDGVSSCYPTFTLSDRGS